MTCFAVEVLWSLSFRFVRPASGLRNTRLVRATTPDAQSQPRLPARHTSSPGTKHPRPPAHHVREAARKPGGEVGAELCRRRREGGHSGVDARGGEANRQEV